MSEDPGIGAASPIRLEILAVLRRLQVLRQEELELLRRLEHVLRDLPEEVSREVRALGQETPGTAAIPEAAEPSAESAAALPSWIEEAVQGALSRAFVSAEEPAPAAPPAAPLVAARADCPLLLLGYGEIQVGIPWEQVDEVGLAEEDSLGGIRCSLRELVRAPAGGALPEPYRVRWRTAPGLVILSCASLGGVVAASAAAEAGVEAVLEPPSELTSGAPVLVSLIDFLARPVPEGEPAGVPELEERPEESSAPTEPEPEPPPQSQPETHPAPPPEAPPEPHPASPPETQPAVPLVARQPEPSPTALLAVRYLPARVALGRALRSDGWTVIEAIDAPEILAGLAASHLEAVLIEVPEITPPDLLPLLRRAMMEGAALVGVRSRIRGAGIDPLRSLGDVPQLLYPFQEIDLERILRSFRPSQAAP